MKEYKCWNRNKNKWEVIKVTEIKFGPSKTDKSKYRPNVNALIGAEGAKDIKGEFDFEDGKDDGTTNYLLRNKGADITELTDRADKILTDAKNKTNEIADQLNAEMQAQATNTTMPTAQNLQ